MNDHRKKCLRLNIEGLGETLDEIQHYFDDDVIDTESIEPLLHQLQEGVRLALKSYEEPKSYES